MFIFRQIQVLETTGVKIKKVLDWSIFTRAARQPKTTKLDDELTEINKKIVDPSKIKANCRNFLEPYKFTGFTDESSQYAPNGPFGPKKFLNLEISQQKKNP